MLLRKEAEHSVETTWVVAAVPAALDTTVECPLEDSFVDTEHIG